MIEPMYAILGVALLIVTWALYRLHRDVSRGDFDLTDLIMHNGKVDKFAFCFMASFAMMTWMIVYMVVHKTITEMYLTIYVGAWVAPLTAKVIWGKREFKPPVAPPS